MDNPPVDRQRTGRLHCGRPCRDCGTAGKPLVPHGSLRCRNPAPLATVPGFCSGILRGKLDRLPTGHGGARNPRTAPAAGTLDACVLPNYLGWKVALDLRPIPCDFLWFSRPVCPTRPFDGELGQRCSLLLVAAGHPRSLQRHMPRRDLVLDPRKKLANRPGATPGTRIGLLWLCGRTVFIFPLSEACTPGTNRIIGTAGAPLAHVGLLLSVARCNMGYHVHVLHFA